MKYHLRARFVYGLIGIAVCTSMPGYAELVSCVPEKVSSAIRADQDLIAGGGVFMSGEGRACIIAVGTASVDSKTANSFLSARRVAQTKAKMELALLLNSRTSVSGTLILGKKERLETIYSEYGYSNWGDVVEADSWYEAEAGVYRVILLKATEE